MTRLLLFSMPVCEAPSSRLARCRFWQAAGSTLYSAEGLKFHSYNSFDLQTGTL